MPNSGLTVKPVPRIAVGGIWHETNTFSAKLTRYEDFEAYQFARGCSMIRRFSQTNTEIGGMLRSIDSLGFESVPTLFAAAVPSGTIERASFARLVDELTGLMRDALPLDGIVLALHGAATAEDIDDADAYILERIQQVAGEILPIAATFDYHANLSDRMVKQASVLIGYDTYPHTDMANRGEEAVNVLASLILEESTLHCAHRKLPLLTSPLKQATTESPMREVMEVLHKHESSPGVTCASVAMGFPYSDVAHLGASVVMYGKDPVQIKTAADSVAMKLWNSRHQFQSDILPVADCVRQAADSPEHPVIIVEPADNIGGGSAGDGTGVLAELLKANADQSVIVVYDPEAVTAAEQSGAGQTCRLRIGGKTDDQHGMTVETTVFVKKILNAEYEHKGSYMTGYITSMGRTALVEAHGVQIVLTSRRSMPFDAQQLRCLGIEPQEQKIIVVKAAIAWKAAYGDIARRTLIVDTPGVCAANLTRLDYRKRPMPLYPLEHDASYSV